MTYSYVNDGKLGASLTSVFTPSTTGYPYAPDVPGIVVGTQVMATDGSSWVRVKVGTGGVTAAGYVCTFDTAFLAVMMSNSVGALGDKIGVSANASAAVANDYIWLQVYGKCAAIQCAGAVAVNTALASTATAGNVDDATGSGTKNISGMVLTTLASGAGQAPGELNWPVIGSTN